MDDQTKLKIINRYVAAEPRVRAACDAIANRYGLRWHDRQDLQQELWLAFTAEWCGRDSDSRNEARADDADAMLPNDMNRAWGELLGGSFTDDRGDGNDRPPLLACTLPCRRLLTPNDTSTDAIRLIDLRMDVAELVSRLPAEDRCCCQRLMADLAAAVHSSSSAASPVETSRVNALRRAFEAHGLRDYL